MLTINQQAVLDNMTEISRSNAERWRSRGGHLYLSDLDRLKGGDETSVFGLGTLTSQLAFRLNKSTGSVLSILKALQRKGIVIHEADADSYQRPLYWWPTGLAEKIYLELTTEAPAKEDDK